MAIIDYDCHDFNFVPRNWGPIILLNFWSIMQLFMVAHKFCNVSRPMQIIINIRQYNVKTIQNSNMRQYYSWVGSASKANG